MAAAVPPPDRRCARCADAGVLRCVRVEQKRRRIYQHYVCQRCNAAYGFVPPTLGILDAGSGAFLVAVGAGLLFVAGDIAGGGLWFMPYLGGAGLLGLGAWEIIAVVRDLVWARANPPIGPT